MKEDKNIKIEEQPEMQPEAITPEPAAPQDGGGAPDPLAKLQAERDALFDRLARQQAEFENFRKRAAREQADYRDFALADAVKNILQVIDNFDLALKAKTGSEADLRKGVELIRKQLDDTLAKLGVKAVPSVGEPFDPHVHEAIEMVETNDARDNHVLEELQRGYRLKERLLRPAMVRVAKKKD